MDQNCSIKNLSCYIKIMENNSKQKNNLMHFFIVRHGETEAKNNPLERGGSLVSGHLETPITKKGKEDMEKVGAQYKDIKFDVCYISPLARSRESAAAFLKGAEQEWLLEDLKVREDLIEINYGPHEGMPVSVVSKIKKDFFESPEGKKVDGLGYIFPGMHPIYGEQESFRAGASRYSLALKKIAQENPGKNILVISHSGVMRALQLCGEISSRGVAIRQDLKFGEVIELVSDGFTLDLK